MKQLLKRDQTLEFPMLQSQLSRRASSNVVAGPPMINNKYSSINSNVESYGITGNKVVSKKSRLHLLITDKVYDQI